MYRWKCGWKCVDVEWVYVFYGCRMNLTRLTLTTATCVAARGSRDVMMMVRVVPRCFRSCTMK